MDRSLFRYIWRYSARQQITTLLLILISFPFLYYSLDLPKTIINEAIGGDRSTVDFLRINWVILGQEISFDGFKLDQLQYLLVLTSAFLALVFINGAFKMRINTYKGVMSERLLRRLRYTLLERSLRFPLPQFQKLSGGEIVTMVSAEVEPLGGFFGDAFALIAFQGGTFLTIMFFMFVQDPFLGAAAFAAIPIQGYIIPKLQRKINLLGKERVKHVRSLSNRMGEVISGIEEVHAQDHAKYTLADFSHRLGDIFWVRFEIYQRKFFMKFLNNFIGQLTPYFFYLIGGYLVLTGGDLTLGALVAALAAYKDLSAPWRELLNYYQRLADARIKYEQIHDQFIPDGMMSREQLLDIPQPVPHLDGEVKATSLSYADHDGMLILDNVAFTLKPGTTTLLTGASGTGRDLLAKITCRLQSPTRGKLTANGHDMAELPESVTGQRIGYQPSTPLFFNTSIARNLYMGVYQSIPQETDLDSSREEEIEEAEVAGNSVHNDRLDWTNYDLAGVSDYESLRNRTVEILKAVELDDDLFALGLRQTADPDRNLKLSEGALSARRRMRRYLEDHGLSDLVRSYDFDAYNDYTTLAENILFGRALADRFQTENLASNPIIMGLVEKHGMMAEFLAIGRRCAETMVEIFQDIPPGHPFFEQFSFVDEDTLPDLKLLVSKVKKSGLDSLSPSECEPLLGLPFKIIPQRHRLGLIDNRMQTRIVTLRKDLHENYAELMGTEVQPFDPEHYNEGLSIQENILFGSIAYGRAEAKERIMEALEVITNDEDLRDTVIRTALKFEVGINGARLTSAQRQKLGLARNLLKRPDLLIVNDGLNSLDSEGRKRIMGRLRRITDGATILWITDSVPEGLPYEQHLELRNGRVSVEGDTREHVEEIEQEGRAGMGSEAQILQGLPLFSELNPNRLKLLAFTAERKTYKAGEDLFRQGDDGDAAYVILKGKADVILESDEHGENALFQLGKNQIVGELALLCDTPRTATIRAETDLTALKLNKEVFTELARHDANFSFHMTRDLSQRLINTTSELNAAKDKE